MEFKRHHFGKPPQPATNDGERKARDIARAFGEWVEPAGDGLRHESLKGFYRWFGGNVRTMGGARNGAEYLGSTAVARRDDVKDHYAVEANNGSHQPPNLIAWEKTGKIRKIDVIYPWPPKDDAPASP